MRRIIEFSIDVNKWVCRLVAVMNAHQYLSHCQAKRQAIANRRAYRFQIASAIALSVLYVASVFAACLACAIASPGLLIISASGAFIAFAASQLSR